MASTSITKTGVFEFLEHLKLGVLGSVSPEGVPQLSLVGIAVTPELEIIFDTVKSSHKYRNLMAKPACSFAIGWAGETTVQFQGDAREPSAGELAAYQEVYFKQWPECRSHLSWPGITYFVVRPTWIRYSDFDQNPPLIQEFNF